jgi:hypothetical protein
MDPILYFHMVGPGLQTDYDALISKRILYDISGKFDPISIRDQITRACLIIQRAVEEEVISSSRPLLIIGGGFSGIAAAHHAVAHYDIPTKIVEKDVLYLEKFNNVAERFISPTAYDFPAKHWRQDSYPLEHFGETMAWQLDAMYAPGLRDEFKDYGRVLDHDYSHLYTSYFETEVIDMELIPPASGVVEYGTVEVQFQQLISGTIFSESFGMVLSCVGFGKENTVLGDFMGVPFWYLEGDRKPYDDGGRHVLICGSGDGALQDFLLIVTGKDSVSEIYEDLEIPVDLENFIRLEIGQAEDYAYRASQWLGGRRDRHGAENKHMLNRMCDIYSRLHQEHKNVVNYVYRNYPYLKDRIALLIEPFFEKNTATIAFMGDHFTKCYAFNRFLVLLLAQYIEDEYGYYGKTVLLPMRAVSSVEVDVPSHEKHLYQYVNHPAQYDDNIERAVRCVGKPHKVKYKWADCNLTKEELNILLEEDLINPWGEPFNQVLVHYGISPAVFPFTERNNCKPFKEPFYCVQILPHLFK